MFKKLVVLLLVFAFGTPSFADAPPRSALTRENFALETDIGGRRYPLTAIGVYPPGEGPFPMAVIAHGTPRGGFGAIAHMSIATFIPQAEEFARRGYAAFVVARRGYAGSEGRVSDYVDTCEGADQRSLTREAGAEMRAAVAALGTRPKVDGTRILAVGLSTGGMAVLSMAAEPVPGLLGVIAFAPGRGSRASGDLCNERSIIQAFAEAGQGVRVPSIMAYALNDSFFGPQRAKRFHEAVVSGGAPTRFVEMPAFGGDGHFVFSREGIPVWRSVVDEFLDSNGFPNWKSAPTDALWPSLAPPDFLTGRARDGFDTYLRAAPHKAFAANRAGNWAYRTGLMSPEAARAAALAACNSSRDQCRIVAVDDELVP